MEMLFSAFEKHQYYNVKDLVKITKQPVVSAMYYRRLLKTSILQCQGLGENNKTASCKCHVLS